ncbi:MAG: M23 family metallopeptidase [Micrococcales bacterium]|nr:M23 family metallopeptidase [Micrococcales bacterium]
MSVRGGGAVRRGRRMLGSAVLAVALAATIGIASPAQPARAAEDYPSWQDVQNAIAGVRNNQALQAQVQAQIQRLQADAAAAQAVAQEKGDAYARAQESADEQQLIVADLQKQVDTATVEAGAARKQVDGLLAELARPGGADLTTSLIAYPGDARDLLYRLGTASKLTKTSQDLYARALQLRNTVQKLTDQAGAAQKELDRRRALAQAAFEAAQAAATAAQKAVDAQSAHLEELKAQLVALQQNTLAIQAKYEEGLAKAQAAAGAEVNLRTGWARPTRGAITSHFGRRVDPTRGGYAFHSGTDIANACGTPIFAARAGTVIYAGPYLDLGNYVLLDNGGGIQTGYGHNLLGGILVSVGQQVKAGQQIARMGSTGRSTGCHSHYLVRINGNLVDPEPFMRGQGMPLS